jgi:ABC-type nitrate/sulfonate/bicarbonate transport system substrate-binding protein
MNAALASGKVDAIFASGGRAEKLIATGEFVAIEDLSRYPDWRLHIANSPFATTVNRDFAERQPVVVVAWLRSVIRAGRWVNDNPVAAAELFSRVLQGGDGGALVAQIAQTDFVPSLSPANLAALAEQKRFLLAENYIERDFAVSDWADDRYLSEALASLK